MRERSYAGLGTPVPAPCSSSCAAVLQHLPSPMPGRPDMRQAATNEVMESRPKVAMAAAARPAPSPEMSVLMVPSRYAVEQGEEVHAYADSIAEEMMIAYNVLSR